jgi:hypothetical protein
MDEKNTLISLFNILETIEIKGSSNVLSMYNAMATIKNKLDELRIEESKKIKPVDIIKGG